MAPGDPSDEPGPPHESHFGGTDRYRIERVLGEGGMGLVYEAYDSVRACRVAVKTIKAFGADALFQFKREFRALQDLHHPHLIHLGELHESDGTWFFTMELVSGLDLVSHVRQRLPGTLGTAATERIDVHRAQSPDIRSSAVSDTSDILRLSEQSQQRLRRCLRDLASALTAVHAAGFVHLDVKPSNVMVEPGGRLVLMDFGLVATAEERTKPKESVVGTVLYIAPEQILGHATGPEADWYSVGCVMYEALRGRPPFTGSTSRILENKLDRLPDSPMSVDPSVPSDLDSLCMALLATDPGARAGADEVFAVLGRTNTSPVLTTDWVDGGESFIGRRSELQKLHRAFRRTRAAGAAAVVVEGESGVGKTMLVREFCRQLEGETTNLLVLRGRCYENENVPYGAFDGIIDSLVEYWMSTDDMPAVDAATVIAVMTGFPVLGRLPIARNIRTSAQHHALKGSAAKSRQLLFSGVRDLFATLTATKRVVIAIEDIQWADRDGLDLMAALFAGENAPPLFAVLSSRDGGRHPPFECTRMRLDGLSDGDAMELLENHFGGVDSAATAQTLLRETGGHPLWLIELARRIRTMRTESASLDDVLWSRIADLDSESRQLVELVCIAGTPLRDTTAHRVSQLEATVFDDRLRLLATHQLLRLTRRDGTRYIEPYHDRIRETVSHHVGKRTDSLDSSHSIAEIHLRIGNALDGELSNDELERDLLPAVRHLNEAVSLLNRSEERSHLAALNLRAAIRSREAGAFERALVYVETAQSLFANQADSSLVFYELLRERMILEYLNGRSESETTFARLLDRTDDAEARNEIVVDMMRLYTGSGRYAEAIDLGRSRLRELGIRFPRRPSGLSVLMEKRRIRRLLADDSVRPLADLPESSDPKTDLILTVLGDIGSAGYFCNRLILAMAALKMTTLSIRRGAKPSTAFGVVSYGLVLASGFGEYQHAHECGEMAHRLVARFPDEAVAAKVQFISGMLIDPWVMPFAYGLKKLSDARRSATLSGDTQFLAFAVSGEIALLRAADHSIPRLIESAEEALSMVQRCREIDIIHNLEVLTGYGRALAHSSGSYEEALAVFDSSIHTDELDDATPVARMSYLLSRASLATIFCRANRAQPFLYTLDECIEDLSGMPSNIEFRMLQVVTTFRCALAGNASWRQRRSAHQAIKLLKGWASLSPANYRIDYRLANAAYLAMRGKSAQANAEFGRVVEEASAAGKMGRYALASELHAELLVSLGKRDASDSAYRRCVDGYRRWGAAAKVISLEGTNALGGS